MSEKYALDKPSMDEVLELLHRILLEDEELQKLSDVSLTSTAQTVDKVLLGAMDIISDSIEKHSDRWSLELDVVESDLKVMLPGDNTLGSSVL